jgi:hypothetical protein
VAVIPWDGSNYSGKKFYNNVSRASLFQRPEVRSDSAQDSLSGILKRPGGSMERYNPKPIGIFS